MAFIFIVMAARSFGAGVQQPAVNALIPQIVPIKQLTRINAINTTIMNTLTLLAPALGGALLASSFVNALFFDVITAAIGILVLCFLAVGKREKNEMPVDTSMVSELKEGLSYVRRTDWLRDVYKRQILICAKKMSVISHEKSANFCECYICGCSEREQEGREKN